MGFGQRPGRAIPRNPLPWKQGEVVADGETRKDTIGGAIDAGATNITVGPGVYEERPELFANEVSIRGSGPSTIIKPSKPVALGGDSVELRDLAVKPTDSTQDAIAVYNSAEGVRIDNVLVDGANTAVWIRSGRQTIVSDLRAKNISTGVVCETDAYSPAVAHATILAPSGDGVTNHAKAAQIDNCKIIDAGGNGVYDDSSISKVTGCTIDGPTSDGVMLEGTDQLVASNSLTNYGGSAINSTNATGAVTSGNTSVASTTAPSEIVDGFESQSLSPYSGNTADAEFIAGFQSGDYALRLNSDGFTRIYSPKGDGLSYYPVKGDTIRLYTRASSGCDLQDFYGLWQDGGNSVHYRIRYDTGEILMIVEESNTNTFYASAAQSLTNDGTAVYQHDVTFGDTLAWEVRDSAGTLLNNASEATGGLPWSDGGIAMHIDAPSGATADFDHVIKP